MAKTKNVRKTQPPKKSEELSDNTKLYNGLLALASYHGIHNVKQMASELGDFDLAMYLIVLQQGEDD